MNRLLKGLTIVVQFDLPELFKYWKIGAIQIAEGQGSTSMVDEIQIRFTESDIGGKRKANDVVTGEYVEEQRKNRIRRICKEMVGYNICIEDMTS
ncbi:MAG: hypothetical protein PHI31_16410 [Desulfuromonadaceae bacterium]|nr:hypothetical protein [Desulfuromonadaceae bacterium]